MRRKRRGMGQVRGADHPAAKLTEGDVVLARLVVAEEGRGAISDLARVAAVTPHALFMAVYGDTWRDLPGAPRKPRTYRRGTRGWAARRKAAR